MSCAGSQAIKCRVESCKHHDNSDYCKLTDIVVGCDKREAKDACETECKSFECDCGC